MTKALYRLSLSRLTNAEFTQFLTQFFEDVDTSGIRLTADEGIVSLYNQLKTQLPPFKASLERVRASDKTLSLAKADRNRDEDFKALEQVVKAFRYSKREAEQEAYASISLLIKQYRPTTNRNYQSQSALMGSLLDKLAVAPYKEQVATLGIKRFADNLATSTRSFDELYSRRAKDKLTQVAYDTKEARANLQFTYTLLVDYINTTAQVKKTKIYTDLVPIINHSRKIYAELLNRKPKTKKVKDDDPQ